MSDKKQDMPGPEDSQEEEFGASLFDFDSGESIDLGSFGKPMITIGRSQEADVHVSGETVSRIHATLTKRDDGYDLIDQGSHNGTAVSYIPFPEVVGRIPCKPNKPYQLRHGDLISLGGINTLEFRVVGGKVPSAI